MARTGVPLGRTGGPRSSFEAPALIRWAEVSKNSGTVSEGGKLLVGLALAAARKDAPAFGARIKAAAESAIAPS